MIINPITNIPKHPKSHVHGWAKHWSQFTFPYGSIDHKFEYGPYDEVYVDHGINFSGTLNLFGGATREVYNKMNMLIECNKIISLDRKMPQYGEMLRKRIGAKTTYDRINDHWCDMVTDKLKTATTLKQEDLLRPSITIGDSHSIAYAAKGDAVFYNSGMTLYGALEKGLSSLLRGNHPDSINFCLGSVDIRHHILRHGTDIDDLVSRYVDQGNAIADNLACNVTYSLPVPIEYEGRRVPKTGYYKQTPFFGPRGARVDVLMKFCDILYSRSNGSVVSPPQNWYHMDGEKYARDIMELASSVHISPEHYRRFGGWNV